MTVVCLEIFREQSLTWQFIIFFLFHLEHVLSQMLTLSFLQIEASGGEAITFGGDVSKEADVESMMKAVSVFCLQKRNVPFHF